MRHHAAVITGCLVALAAPSAGADDAKWTLSFADNAKLGKSFKQLELARPDGSVQVAFLGHFDEPLDRKKPLLVFFDGSGANSQFVAVGDKVGAALFGLIAKLACDDYHVLACEKRGVKFLESGRGGAQSASAEYHRYATFEDRVADGVRLIDAVLKQATADPARVVVVGHSEGADVAAGVAAAEPRVTHVAFLSGGGPTQFFDLMLMRRKALQRENAAAAQVERAMDELTRQFREIVSQPENTEKLFMGHAYRRWASFGTHAPLDSLRRTQARAFVAHGSADESVPIESFDVLVAELLAAGKTGVTVRRYPGCDHGFQEKGAEAAQPAIEGVFREILAWAAE